MSLFDELTPSSRRPFFDRPLSDLALGLLLPVDLFQQTWIEEWLRYCARVEDYHYKSSLSVSSVGGDRGRPQVTPTCFWSQFKIGTGVGRGPLRLRLHLTGLRTRSRSFQPTLDKFSLFTSVLGHCLMVDRDEVVKRKIFGQPTTVVRLTSN